MRRRRPIDFSGPWRLSLGAGASRVLVIERFDRHHEIYLRYRDPLKVQRGVRDPRSYVRTGLFARRSPAVCCDMTITQAATREAVRLHVELEAAKGNDRVAAWWR